MNRYFLAAKAAVSIALAYYIPAWIPFIAAYWVGVAFIYWRGKRGLPQPGAVRVAVEYLGGYPGLEAPQRIWLSATRAGLVSGGLRIPYGAMRRVRLLRGAEGQSLARAEGLAAVAAAEGDLFLALLWRDPEGAEREFICRLPGGRGEKELARLRDRVEAARRKEAERRRGRA